MPDAPGLSAACDALLAPRNEHRIVPGLDRVSHALAALGHPDRNLTSVLVLGTNGKGSTAAMLASMLHAQGTRVGLFTSPHLLRVEERIRIDGSPLDPDRLLTTLTRLERFPQLSYFETLTAAALLAFADAEVELAVLEAGLGGRWDATNAVSPAISLLTNVGSDHHQWLGSERGTIAAEKAAALRGREAIVGCWDDEVETTIRATADPVTPVSEASRWASVLPDTSTEDELEAGRRPGTPVVFTVAGLAGRALLPLLGRHQLDNLRLALAAIAALAEHGLAAPLTADWLRRGIEETRWPGRLEWRRWRNRELLLDGAHNREAAAALAAALEELDLSGRVHLVFSCLDDKPAAELAHILAPHAASVTVTTIDSPRATDLATLAAAFPGARPEADLAAAMAAAPPELPVLVTGSLRLVGEAIALVIHERSVRRAGGAVHGGVLAG